MSRTICLGANALRYPEGGGHQWVFLNWALGFRANGCNVIWLEQCNDDEPAWQVQARVDALKHRLTPYGLGDCLAICGSDGEFAGIRGVQGCLDLQAAAESDLLFNASYFMGRQVVRRFRRSALLDIDPGLLQRWLSRGEIDAAEYDLYFTIGETVGTPDALFPDAGLTWIYTPPCVALEWWPVCPQAEEGVFTTIAHWYMHEWVEDDDGEVYENNKRSGFVPYFDLPRYSSQRLELALCLGAGDEAEKQMLEAKGWSIRDARDVSATPWAYQQYIQQSRGEFSGAKPSWVRLQNAWISDRTLCFLASGKPAVVQHTGPSRFLPERAGLFRFHNFDEAVEGLASVSANYTHHSRCARALAEEYFNAKTVTGRILEQAF